MALWRFRAGDCWRLDHGRNRRYQLGVVIWGVIAIIGGATLMPIADERVQWANTTVLSGDLAAASGEMKAEDSRLPLLLAGFAESAARSRPPPGDAPGRSGKQSLRERPGWR